MIHVASSGETKRVGPLVPAIVHVNNDNGVMYIPEALAQGIVERLRTVLNSQVNFIGVDGCIIASTDRSRIGATHEAGLYAATHGRPVVVHDEADWPGARRGVNAPMQIDGTTIGVVGVTGDPERVAQFGSIIGEMTSILLKEELARTSDINRRERQRLLVEALLEGTPKAAIDDPAVGAMIGRGCVVIRIEGDAEHARKDFVFLENLYSASRHVLGPVDGSLIAVRRGGVNAVLPVRQHSIKEVLRRLWHRARDRCGHEVSVGVSSPVSSVEQLVAAQSDSTLALCVSRRRGSGPVFFEDLDLELIEFGVSKRNSDALISKVIGGLDEDDRRSFDEMLQVYEDNDGSLQATADALYIHRNTLQYRLNALARRTGYNPRRIKDHMRLRLAFDLARISDLG